MSVAAIDPRDRLYDGLRLRNRIVGVLRWAVPAAGAALVLVLVGQALLRSLAEQYGVSNIAIDRNNLVVDAPRMSGTWEGGMTYNIEAKRAHAALDDTSVVTLDEARLMLKQPNGDTLTATAPSANVELASQKVEAPGVTDVTSSGGLKGTLVGLRGDIAGQVLTAGGGVDIAMPDGTGVTATTLHYDLKTRVWEFAGGVSVTLPMTPGDKP